MQEDRTCTSNKRKTEISGVVYNVTSYYSTSGSLEEMLKKTAMEVISVAPTGFFS